MPKRADPARRARVDERRAQILTAAAKVFGRKGYDRATIADIALEAKVAEGSIYNYFKNKADLLVSIPRLMVQPAVESITGQMFPPTGGPPPPEIMLTFLARTILATIRRNAYLFRILLTAMPSLKQSAREEYMQNVVTYATGMLQAYLQEEIEQHALRKDLNPTIAARTFIGMFFPFVLIHDVLQVDDPAEIDDEQLVEHNVGVFLNGVRADRSKRSSR